MMGAAYLFNRHLGKKKREKKQNLRMRHKTAQDVLDHLHDRSSFFVQWAPEKTNTKNRQNSNMRHKMTQDVQNELHDGSSFFVQQAREKETKRQMELQDEAEDVLTWDQTLQTRCLYLKSALCRYSPWTRLRSSTLWTSWSRASCSSFHVTWMI